LFKGKEGKEGKEGREDEWRKKIETVGVSYNNMKLKRTVLVCFVNSEMVGHRI